VSDARQGEQPGAVLQKEGKVEQHQSHVVGDGGVHEGQVQVGDAVQSLDDEVEEQVRREHGTDVLGKPGQLQVAPPVFHELAARLTPPVTVLIGADESVQGSRRRRMMMMMMMSGRIRRQALLADRLGSFIDAAATPSLHIAEMHLNVLAQCFETWRVTVYDVYLFFFIMLALQKQEQIIGANRCVAK
jgi:hypothetical protein